MRLGCLYLLCMDIFYIVPLKIQYTQTSKVVQILYMVPRIEIRLPPVSGHMVLSTSCKFPLQLLLSRAHFPATPKHLLY